MFCFQPYRSYRVGVDALPGHREALKLNRSLTTIQIGLNDIGDPGAEAWRRAGRTCGGRI